MVEDFDPKATLRVMEHVLTEAGDRGYVHPITKLALLKSIISWGDPDETLDEASSFVRFVMYRNELKRHVMEIIFDPEFARALWGEDTWSVDPTGWHKKADASPAEEQAWYLPAYEYHLQQMVTSDNYIKYLEENS